MTPRTEIETAQIGTGPHALRVPRIITGLWQAANADVAASARKLVPYADAGLDAFDTADIYGGAEDIVGTFRRDGGKCISTTKWCPAATVVGADKCAAAVETATSRLGRVDLLQYHAWNWGTGGYLENLWELSKLRDAGKFGLLGVTNFDLAHMKLLRSSGYDIASNQVGMSVLDVRVELGGLAAWSKENGIPLLAYGTLLGGFVSHKWLGAAEPALDSLDSPSKQKWKRTIDAAGGWKPFQGLLSALDEIARKHGCDVTAVATRYVLDIPGVAAAIVGIGSEERLESTLAVFALKLDDSDRKRIREAQAHLTPLQGDAGDEMRYAPFLNPGGAEAAFAQTQSGVRRAEIERVAASGGRVEYMSGSLWEPVVGFCRSVRVGQRALVAGTTTRRHPSGKGVIGGDSAEDQATYVFDIIRGALAAVGASMADVVRTRILFTDVDRDWEAVGHVQAREILARHGTLPTNTMVGGLTYVVGPQALLEIEAEAIIGAGEGQILRLDPRNP